MKTLHVKSFADLMNGQPWAVIRDPYSGKVVRKLSQAGGKVQVDALLPPIVSVSLNEAIDFVPWVMDRGNLTFKCDEIPGGIAKLCTEADTIGFANGETFSIGP